MPRVNARLSALLSLAVCALPAHAATIFVSPCGNNGWTGANAVCIAPAGPKRTIQAAINSANPGDFVHVLPGSYAEKIDLNGKGITLLGTGGAASTTIDGNAAGTVVTLNSLEGPGTVIRGFTIRNGNAAEGGGMLIALSNPTIEECVIFDNFADNSGAGVAIIAASPTFTDCQFVDNSADAGGLDLVGHGGGMSITGGSPTIVGCSFSGNSAQNHGGGIAILESAVPTIEDCTFENNVQWTYCSSEPCSPLHSGAAVSSIDSEPTFSGCTFHENYTGGHGAVVISGGSATFNTSTFTDNQPSIHDFPGIQGGGLSAESGAVVSLLACSFSGNWSNETAGAVFVNNASLSATFCGFSSNVANDGRGGAIDAVDSQVAISVCTFGLNSASHGGGAISMADGALDVSGSIFSNNVVPDIDTKDSRSGGAILLENAFAEVSSSTFTGNSSPYKGGAIVRNPLGGPAPADLFAPDLIVENSQFTGNAARFGGGIEISGGVAHVVGSTFDSNHAATPSADGAGGGLATGHAAYARVEDSEFVSNTAGHFGGAIGVYGSLDAIGSTFTGNSADTGGAIYAASNNTVASAFGCRFSGNSVTEDGSAAYVTFQSEMNLVNCLIYKNTAPASSAAVEAGSNAASLRVTNCTIHLNSGGGGIMSNDAAIPVFVSNSIIWGHSGPQVAIIQGAVEYSDVQGGHPGEGNIDANPSWVGALGGNYHLNANSPCIDAGRTAALPQDAPDLDTDDDSLELIPLDFYGDPRVTDMLAKADTGCSSGFVVDIGASEAAGTTSPPIMPGDANADGSVNFADLTYVLTNWGDCNGCCPADVDGNGEVGFNDLTQILTFWS